MRGIPFPGVRYRQGSDREMVVTALEPHALLQIVHSDPEYWNPLGRQPHGNRPRDPAHRARIADYLETNDSWVLGAVVLYISPGDAEFTPAPGWEGEPIAAGELTIRFGCRMDIGDGQHRIGGLEDVITAHSGEDDPIQQRLRHSGQPAVVVIDDDRQRRAQDFTDLQQNVKTPAASITLSMDGRQPINRLVLELIQREDIPIFDRGNRIEFHKDSPGKLSPRLFSFKTVRYATGTALIGTSQHQAAAWQMAANKLAVDQGARAMDDAAIFWRGIGVLPVIERFLSGQIPVRRLREESLVTSAGVQYAIAYAFFLSRQDGMTAKQVVKALSRVGFDRPRYAKPPPSETDPITPEESIFAGNLVDPITAKIASGRPAWEAAGKAIHRAIKALS